MRITQTEKNKIFIPLVISFIVLIPVFVAAQGGLTPDCGITQADGSVNSECGYEDLLRLVNRIIDWIIMISVPVAAGVFAWAGIKYMTTGVSDQKSEAKEMLRKVFFGFVFILAAWIIVTTILNALLSETSGVRDNVPVEGVTR